VSLGAIQMLRRTSRFMYESVTAMQVKSEVRKLDFTIHLDPRNPRR